MEGGIAEFEDGVDAQTNQLAMFGVCDIGVIYDGSTERFEGARSASQLGQCINCSSHPMFPGSKGDWVTGSAGCEKWEQHDGGGE